jgi:hypothetical protein
MNVKRLYICLLSKIAWRMGKGEEEMFKSEAKGITDYYLKREMMLMI